MSIFKEILNSIALKWVMPASAIAKHSVLSNAA
jgi:hypothetical protein